MRRFVFSLAVLAAVTLCTLVAAPLAAFAQDAPSTSIDVGTFILEVAPYATEAASLIVIAAIGWVTVFLKRKLGIDIEARHREALHSAIMTGLGVAASRHGGSMRSIKVDVDSAFLAETANYVLQSVPDAVRYFGVTPERIAEIAAAKLNLPAPPAKRNA